MRWLTAAAVVLLVTQPENSRVAAIGPRNGLPPALARALARTDGMFWPGSACEASQSHADVNRPDAQRHTLYLQPLGRFGDDAPRPRCCAATPLRFSCWR